MVQRAGPGRVNSHLIGLGLRLRWIGGDSDQDFTYADLWDVLMNLPAGTPLHNHLFRDIDPDDPDQERQLDQDWDLSNMLLAKIADSLAVQIWHNTKDGQRGKNPPEPILRPGVTGNKKKTRIQGHAIRLDELMRKQQQKGH